MLTRVTMIILLTVSAIFSTELNAAECSDPDFVNINDPCTNAKMQADRLAASLPMLIDSSTTLTNAAAIGKRIQLTYKINRTETDGKRMADNRGLTHEEFWKMIGNTTRSNMCQLEGVVAFVNVLGGEYQYQYMYRDGTIAYTTILDTCVGP